MGSEDISTQADRMCAYRMLQLMCVRDCTSVCVRETERIDGLTDGKFEEKANLY